MERWTRLVIRLRWLVLAAWVLVFLAANVASRGLSDLYESQAGLPGSDAQRVNDVLERDFGQKSYAGFTVVVRTTPGRVDALRSTLDQRARLAASRIPSGAVVGVEQISDTTLAASVASKLDTPQAADYTDEVRQAMRGIPDTRVWVTGNAALNHDLTPVFAHDLKVGELYFAIPIALAILVFVFGTLAFLLPFVFALATIPVTLGVVWIFAHWMPMEESVSNLVTLIGLGIAIDYSLLVVYRYRDELKAGDGRVEALVRTMKTAGHAVVFSGTAVAIGLALMLALPVPGLRGYGLGGLLVPLVSLAAALTLLPVLLYFLERPLDRVRLVPRRVLERRESQRDEDNFWLRLAHRIMRRPALFAATALVLLVAAAVPLFALELGPGTNENLPARLESVQGQRILEREVGDGVLNPTEIVVDTGRGGGASDPAVQSGTARLVSALDQDPEVARVVQESGPSWFSPDGRYIRLQAVTRHAAGSTPSKDFVQRLRDDIVPSAEIASGARVYAGGLAAYGVDFLDKTYGAFPLLVATVLVLTYFLLMRAFRSLLLPLKAIVLNLLSICAAYGVMVAVFQWGIAGHVGLISYDQITGWVPVFLFAMLFGLSMDYEVFLVSRMREEWDRGASNADAIAIGLAKTGRLVTAAGAIMFAAFMGFVAGSFIDLQQFGLGLAAAILIDVTIVRALLLPSAMALFGRWNWWLPAPVARVARVEPSPLAEPAEKPAAAPSV